MTDWSHGVATLIIVSRMSVEGPSRSVSKKQKFQFQFLPK